MKNTQKKFASSARLRRRERIFDEYFQLLDWRQTLNVTITNTDVINVKMTLKFVALSSEKKHRRKIFLCGKNRFNGN